MYVIDVNSTGYRKTHLPREQAILDINMNAAQEIARHIKLRNLSGIIIVDFIDMEHKDHEKTLLEALRKAVKDDKTITNVVDMTPLGIVEIVRQRSNLPANNTLEDEKTLAVRAFKAACRHILSGNNDVTINAQAVIIQTIDRWLTDHKIVLPYKDSTINLKIDDSFAKGKYKIN